MFGILQQLKNKSTLFYKILFTLCSICKISASVLALVLSSLNFINLGCKTEYSFLLFFEIPEHSTSTIVSINFSLLSQIYCLISSVIPAGSVFNNPSSDEQTRLPRLFSNLVPFLPSLNPIILNSTEKFIFIFIAQLGLPSFQYADNPLIIIPSLFSDTFLLKSSKASSKEFTCLVSTNLSLGLLIFSTMV